jgi:hypothetical protein
MYTCRERHNEGYFILGYEAIQSSYIINEVLPKCDEDLPIYTAPIPGVSNLRSHYRGKFRSGSLIHSLMELSPS